MLTSQTSDGALKRSGFTLVELLVVITIIGILIGMLMPAVNAARESGRNVTCKNNLNQMGKAFLAHEQAQEIFPTGGWGWCWVGDPDRGYGTQQPGGWFYNILPHTEMNQLHDQQFVVNGAGVSGKTPPGTAFPTAASTTKQQAIMQMVSTPVPFANCPTRRRAALYTNVNVAINNAGGVPVSQIPKLARTDYAVSCGTAATDQYGAGPAVGADYYAANGTLAASATAAQASYFASRATTNIVTYTGICFEQSTIRKDDVTAGLSYVLMLGEKYICAKDYDSGADLYDNENMYVGFDNDIGRTTGSVVVGTQTFGPMQDNWNNDDGGLAFGSAHATAANFVLCDGAVISINYQVDPPTYLLLGCRNTSQPVDMTKITGGP